MTSASAGEYRDVETGYIYLRARFYDPDLGRFLNADPAKHGTNWYAYAGGNPVLYTDPSGLFFKEVWNGVKNTGKKIVNAVKAGGKVIQSAASVAGKKLKEFASTNVGKVVIGVTVIALAGVATVLTGGMAGGFAGSLAYGFFTGALMGGAMGAAAGGTEAVLSNRRETGSWSGSMQAFTDGAASGFFQGTISGGVMGSIGAGAKYGMKALGKGLNPLSQRVRTGKGASHQQMVSNKTYTLKNPRQIQNKNPLENIQYTDKVKAQMKQGDYHSFPEAVEAFGADGTRTSIIGGDKITRTKIEISGSYRGKDGLFQYIIEPDGITCNHRLFCPR